MGSIHSTIRADVAPDIAYFTKPSGDINDILLHYIIIHYKKMDRQAAVIIGRGMIRHRHRQWRWQKDRFPPSDAIGYSTSTAFRSTPSQAKLAGASTHPTASVAHAIIVIALVLHCLDQWIDVRRLGGGPAAMVDAAGHHPTYTLPRSPMPKPCPHSPRLEPS